MNGMELKKLMDVTVAKAVKEFAEKLKEICLQRGEWDEDCDDMNPEYFNIGCLCIEDIDRLYNTFVKNIAKKYGVEVEE